MTVIIVEGPDGSGKSTLAERLRRTFRVEVHHSGGPPDSIEAICEMYARQLGSRGAIWDRNVCISELVYARVLGRLSLPRHVLWGMFDDFVEEGWAIVYCRPSDATLLQHDLARAARGKDHKSIEHVMAVEKRAAAVIREYDAVMNVVRRKGMPVMAYDRDQNFLREVTP